MGRASSRGYVAERVARRVFADRIVCVIFARYIIRPVRPATLVACLLGISSLGAWGVAWGARQFPVADGSIVSTLFAVGIALGACTSLVVGSDVDPVERLLASMPRSLVATLTIRVTAWLTLASGAVVFLSWIASDPLLSASSSTMAVALTPLLISAAAACVAGRFFGSITGGGIALVTGTAVILVSWFYPEWVFAVPLDPTKANFASQARLLVALSAALMLSALCTLRWSATRARLSYS